MQRGTTANTWLQSPAYLARLFLTTLYPLLHYAVLHSPNQTRYITALHCLLVDKHKLALIGGVAVERGCDVEPH